MADADASTTSTNNLALGAGSLSIGSMGASSNFPAVTVTAGTVSGAVDQANWNDNTGTGNGWNGTVSTTNFVDNGTWVAGSGALALGSGASGSYTGTAGQASYSVSVTSAVPTVSTTVSWSDTEGAGTTATTGSGTVCTDGSACAIGTHGVTITFATTGTYTNTMSYTLRSGTLANSALSLANASATGPTPQGTTLGGANNPSFVAANNGVTITGGGPTTQGAALKFVSAAVLTGMGSFQLAPGFTVVWDANNTWAATYSATAQYTIVTGP